LFEQSRARREGIAAEEDNTQGHGQLATSTRGGSQKKN
jgi:hypothetical protein